MTTQHDSIPKKNKTCVFCEKEDSAQHRGVMVGGKWICVHCWHGLLDIANPVPYEVG